MSLSKIIVIDTETNGLPVTKGFNDYYEPTELQHYSNARIIEIGYIIYDLEGNTLAKREFMIKPDNFNITNSNIHGITFEMANATGISMLDALDILEVDMLDVILFVAHNVQFDLNIIMAECIRYNKLSLFEKLYMINKECTMMLGKTFLKSSRFPQLKQLYKIITNKEEEQLHRALDDSRMCAECYFGMKILAIPDTTNKIASDK